MVRPSNRDMVASKRSSSRQSKKKFFPSFQKRRGMGTRNKLTRRNNKFIFSMRRQTQKASMYRVGRSKNLFFRQLSARSFSNKWKTKLTNFSKIFFYLTLKPLVAVQAYKLFLLMELQLSVVLLRTQLVPFFFLVRDLCFYRLVFVNYAVRSNPHLILSLYDVIQLPLFFYHIMNYRQNRFYLYPKFLQKFFKLFWGQFTDYNTDKVWLLSNYLGSKITGEVLIYTFPNILLYLSPFRRFAKLYYKMQPERPRNFEAGLSYTYTVFKLHIFNYANFYK